MKQERRTTVRTASDATVNKDSLAGSIVIETTSHGLNDAPVSDSTFSENILKKLLLSLQLKSAKVTENDIKVFYSEIQQQKIACGKKKNSFIEKEALLRAKKLQIQELSRH